MYQKVHASKVACCDYLDVGSANWSESPFLLFLLDVPSTSCPIDELDVFAGSSPDIGNSPP